MKLVVGLGNLGDRFRLNRHNLGFMVLDRLAERIGLLSPIERFLSIAFREIEQPPGQQPAEHPSFQREKNWLIKPMTSMNFSGRAVKKYVRFYRIKFDDVLIIHDELDLPFGETRLEKNRTSAGHRGVESVISELGSKAFYRLRIGISRPPANISAENYVLSDFTLEERRKLDQVVDRAATLVIDYLLNES